MPHRLWLPGVGGLCDGGPHVCTRIDEIAFNARIDAVLSTSTDRRGFAFAAPYGFSFAIGERLEGGISTASTVWRQTINGNDETSWQQAPLRFWVKGVLWPWLKDPHQHFAVVASFEQEARLWRFDGPNQLGLPTDLAALRIAVNKPLGLVELGLQFGALWDWQGRYGALEYGSRIGFHLPFLPDTKIFAEFLARNTPAFVHSDTPLPGALDPSNPLAKSAVLAFGLVTRPRRQVDFAMVVSLGFGDVAPFMLTIRGPLDFSMGKGYPYPQSLVVDILRDAGQWIAEQVRNLPEPMRETCVLYGRDGQPIATLGTLAADGEHCEFQGQRFRLGDKLYPDPAQRRVCLDAEATRCVAASQAGEARATIEGAGDGSSSRASVLPAVMPGSEGTPPANRLDPAMLQQLLNQGALGPIRGQLDEQCILNEGNQQVSPIGHRSPDGKHCILEQDVVNKKSGQKVRTETQRIPIGESVYRDPVTGRVCLTPNTKGRKDCLVAIDPEHNRPLTADERAGYHGAIGLGKKIDQYSGTAKHGVELLTDTAKLSTAAHEAEQRAEQAAKSAIATLKDPHKAKEAAREAWDGTVDTTQSAWEAAKNWWKKPPEKKMDDVAEAGGSGLADVPMAAGTAILTGGPGRALSAGVDLAEEAEAGAKSAKALAAAEEKASQAARPRRRFSMKDRDAAFEASKDTHGVPRCEYCSSEVQRPKGTGHSYEADHRQPYSKGGESKPDNLAPACRDCNRQKGNKELHQEWTPPRERGED